jgi:hypothetical protein
VHVAVYFHTFYHFVAVGFEPAIEIVQIYFASLGLIGIYFLYCIMMKNRR